VARKWGSVLLSPDGAVLGPGLPRRQNQGRHGTGCGAGLTRVVGQAASLAVEAEPPLPPGLDAAAHLHQGPAAAAPQHPQVRAAFGVVAPAFQVLPEVQDAGSWGARWGRGWGLRSAEKGQLIWSPGGSQFQHLPWKVCYNLHTTTLTTANMKMTPTAPLIDSDTLFRAL
jgi:hypothetical protein